MPLALHAPLVVFVALTLWISDDPVTTLTLGGVASFPVYLLLAWVEARRAPLFFSPLSFYFLWYSVCFGLSAVHIANRIERGDIIGFSITYVHPENIAPAYLIYLIGSFALHAGVQIFRPLPTPPTDAPRGAHFTVSGEASRAGAPVLGFALLWGAGIIVRLFGPSLSFLGAAQGVLNWAALTGLCAYAIFRGADRDRGLVFWAVLGLGTLIELYFSLRTGSKAFIMFAFIPVVWLMTRDRRLHRWFLPTFGALLLFYVTLVAPVVSASRNRNWRGEAQADRIISTYLDQSYQDSGDSEDQVNKFLERQFDPIPVAFLHREVERTGLRYGETMDYLLYAFIPRILWADKPAVTRGGWFTLYLGQARKESDVSTSTGQTAIGELYWNFGYQGVVLGMAALGTLIGALWRLTRARAHEDALLFLLYMSLAFGMLDMPEAGTVLVSVVYRALVIGMLVWVIRYVTPLLPRRL